ncbi:MAG: twin-arginine translocase subunit TatC [Dehalococcoidales bacterium]|nr:twin-arginine translocase subunit TatC [Dehalococcoidales bacterium]
MSETRSQSILGHLRELRKRVIWIVIAIAVTTAASFFFADQIINFLKVPAGDVQFILIEVTEAFSTYMKVCFIVGIIAAMPIIMYNALMFVMPALTSRERRLVLLILPWVLIMFFGGIYFGYKFLIPPATHFLLGFGSNVALIQPRLSNYVNFVINLLLVIGLMFEMPVVIAFLARIGVVSARWLMGKQKIVIILSFVVSATITPTPDAINQSIVAGTLIVLYELSLLIAWLIEKKKKETIEVTSTND